MGNRVLQCLASDPADGRWWAVDGVLRRAVPQVAPAAVLLVAHKGWVCFYRAYGWLDADTRTRPARPDSIFDLASLTKPFTATAFMRLVDAGQVGLDVPVVTVIPEFDGLRPIGPSEDPMTKTMVPADPVYRGRTVDAGGVTFRHLLSHTSGLPAWRAVYCVTGEGYRRSLEARHGRGIAAICGYDFAYPIGSRVVYSDLGFILVGEAVSRLAGQRLDHAIRALVLQPLGLKDTTFNPPSAIRVRIAPTEVCPWRGRRLRGEVHDENTAGLGGVAGHAGLFATAWDVAVLGQCYLNGGVYGDTRLLARETAAEMTRLQGGAGNGGRGEEERDFLPSDQPRGLGWQLRAAEGASCGRHFGPRSFGHTGFTGTSLWIDPDVELLVVLLTNRVYHGRDNATEIHALRVAVHDSVTSALKSLANYTGDGKEPRFFLRNGRDADQRKGLGQA